ncbi:MAG: DUF1492 domain-containing protein [Synergistaceae bacterium]|nr:DUF1492 domain-containing protein [Synergistaceae bacterium]
MKKSDKFRFAEKCLYGYKKNLACLEILQGDLAVVRAGVDVKAQSYQLMISFSGEPSDPVSSRLIKIESIEDRISKLERITKPITKLISDLNGEEILNGSRNKDLMQILRLLYFGNNTPEAIMQELNIAKTTYFKRRQELVFTTIDYMGL